MKILYAEDEKQLSSAVTEILKMEGFSVTSVYDGGKAWELAQGEYFDAVVLDVMMPVMDGIEVLERMRAAGNYTPVLMLTAKTAVDDRIAGITSGADDYLGKPFAMRELVARLNSLIRRATGYRRQSMRYLNITLDMGSGELSTENGSLRLNNHEAELLSHLIRNPETLFTKEELNEAVWNGKESPEKAELYVWYLKNKLTQIRAEAHILTEGERFGLGGRNE